MSLHSDQLGKLKEGLIGTRSSEPAFAWDDIGTDIFNYTPNRSHTTTQILFFTFHSLYRRTKTNFSNNFSSWSYFSSRPLRNKLSANYSVSGTFFRRLQYAYLDFPGSTNYELQSAWITEYENLGWGTSDEDAGQELVDEWNLTTPFGNRFRLSLSSYTSGTGDILQYDRIDWTREEYLADNNSNPIPA